MAMKKFIVALALAGGVAAFAYASLQNRDSPVLDRKSVV